MPSPEGYFLDDRCDLDPPRRGSPMLVGDVSRLAGIRSVSEVRDSPGAPLTARQRKIKRKHIVIFLARVSGLPLDVIADAFDLTRQEISRVCIQMGYDDV